MLSSNVPCCVVLALPEGADPALCQWWGRVLSDGFGSKVREVCLAEGDFWGAVAAHALRVGASLIVVPPLERSLGRAVTSLAAATAMPVLVARHGNFQSAIVAATDLQSTAYPVLRLASKFERCLNVPVVTVHNVQPISMVVSTGMTGPSLILLPPATARAARLDRLTRASARFFEEAQAVLRDEASVAHAIVDEARRQDAALVVVGTRKRSWWERLLTGSIAEQIVNQAGRSVLVAPLDDRCS